MYFQRSWIVTMPTCAIGKVYKCVVPIHCIWCLKTLTSERYMYIANMNEISTLNLIFQMQTKGPCLEEILCPQTSQCFDSVPEKVGLLSFLYMCSFFCFNFHYQSKAFLVSLHFLFHCFVITKLICMLSHNHIALFCITCFLLIACNPSSASSFPFLTICACYSSFG